jgi:16S rRNA (cytosine967-C5)-methyltransferase
MQARLLRALWPLLAPGGLMVYATCTVLRRENGEQMAAFRGAEPAAEAGPSWQNLPGEAEGDGFYYAGLRKPHALPTASVPPQP